MVYWWRLGTVLVKALERDGGSSGSTDRCVVVVYAERMTGGRAEFSLANYPGSTTAFKGRSNKQTNKQTGETGNSKRL
jgi:hypothetical protein